ncbi:hypothetical protein EMIT0196MI5_120104 [Pseudomonas sp. IT-196MI5]
MIEFYLLINDRFEFFSVAPVMCY